KVVESEKEIEFEAPPVPEPTKVVETPEIPDISIPEPTEIEFKTPDEIMVKEAIKTELESLSGDETTYRPKTIPFTNAPEPAPPPKGFQSPPSDMSTESTAIHTPFRVIKREEPLKPQPASMTFEPRPKPKTESPIRSPIFQSQTPSESKTESTSDSLFDYMPQTIISKKEKKKVAKEKKKQDKEKAKIEKEKKVTEKREKQESLLEDMKKSKKDKKEKKPKQKDSKPSPTPPPSKPQPKADSLFQTLTHRTEDLQADHSVPFMLFAGGSKTKEEGTSKLRIIPNVADIETETNSFTAFTSTPQKEVEKSKSKSKELLICEQCGSILSSDYTFCNKCGNKL
ncbi:MAG: hypothetical protein ACXABG_14945, partial [Promethearchaeota archaeon]